MLKPSDLNTPTNRNAIFSFNRISPQLVLASKFAKKTPEKAKKPGSKQKAAATGAVCYRFCTDSAQTFFHICSHSVQTCHRLSLKKSYISPHILRDSAIDSPLLRCTYSFTYVARVHSGSRQSHVPAILKCSSSLDSTLY